MRDTDARYGSAIWDSPRRKHGDAEKKDRQSVSFLSGLSRLCVCVTVRYLFRNRPTKESKMQTQNLSVYGGHEEEKGRPFHISK